MRYKQILRAILPASVMYRLGGMRARLADRRYASMGVQDTFADIYRSNMWGGGKGQMQSGEGSAHPSIVGPYLLTVRQVLDSMPAEDRRVVDLGCGDFRVGEQLYGLCRSYVGVDVVPQLIAELRQRPYPSHVSFACANIVEDDIPAGTVCLLRQVLQHLSNAEISQILPKLRSFTHVIVTEHFPVTSRFIRPNVDKAHGPGIRVSEGSAVCLEEPPFGVRAQDIVRLLDVPGDGVGSTAEAGIIRTFMFPGTAIPSP